METYYTVYKITNKISGRFYIGCHKTTNLNDGYMGSGKYLKHAINKYGLDNFEKEILHICNSPEEMFKIEKELVDESLVKSPDTYNLVIGGLGGFSYINDSSSKHRARCSGAGKKGMRTRLSPTFKEQEYEIRLKAWKTRIKNGTLTYIDPHAFKGRTHTDETKKKMSESKKITASGKNNSQYGTMWITDGINNKKIKRSDNIPEGWKNGRVMRV